MVAVGQTVQPTTTVQPTVQSTINNDGYEETNKRYGDYKYQDYLNKKDYKVYKKDGKSYYLDEKSNRYIDMDTPTMTSAEQDRKDYEEAVKNGYVGDSIYKGKKQVQPTKISDRVNLETSNLTDAQKKKYTKSLIRQEKERDSDLAYVRRGGAGLTGTIGELQNVGRGVDEAIIEPISRAPESYQLGKLNQQLSQEYYKKMLGKNNDAKIDDLNRQISIFNQFNNDVVQSNNQLDTYFKNLPNEVSGITSGVKGGGALGAIGAIGGGAIGLLTTKDPATATVFAQKGAQLLGGAGYVTGQAKNTFELEAGAEYQALLEMGVPDDIARKEALRVGTENALIESGESILDLVTLGKSSVAIDKLKDGLLKRYGSDMLKNWGVSYLTNVASEAGQEALQEDRSIAGEKRAAEKAGIERDSSQDMSRRIESAKSGALGAILSGGATKTLGVATNTAKNSAFNMVNNNINNRQANTNITQSNNQTTQAPIQEQNIQREATQQAAQQATQEPIQQQITPVNEQVNQTVEPIKTEALNTAEKTELEQLKNMPFELDDTQNKRLDELLQKQNKEIENKMTPVRDLNEIRNFEDMGSKKVNAYQYDNPEVKPYFKDVAEYMLDDLNNSQKGERFMTEDGEWGGQSRIIADDIASLLDGENGTKYSYEDIKNGLNAIIKDNGAENKAVAKRIEFYIDQRLRNGFTTWNGEKIQPNSDYLNTLKETNIKMAEGTPTDNTTLAEEVAKEPVIRAENEKPIKAEKTPKSEPKAEQNVETSTEQDKEVSKIMDKIPEERKPKLTEKAKKALFTIRHKFTDHQAAIYDMSRGFKNPTLYHKADAIMSADSWAQNMLDKRQTDTKGNAYNNFTDENGNKVSMGYKKAYELYKNIPDSDKASFLVHMRNIDQMKNGIDQFEIPLETSEKIVAELRDKHKDIDKWGENIWTYGHNQLQNMVDAGFRSQEVADQYLKDNPHYVRIQRNVKGSSSALETKGNNAKVKNPVQKIKGSTLEIMPLKETQAQYTREVMKAIKLNEFGQEYAKTVGVSSDGSELTNIEDMFGIDEKVLNGEKGNYTFTIFDKGRPITLPINEGIYESLKSRKVSEVPILSDLTSVQRELLTNKNLYFASTNAVKDFSDMMLYSKFPAYKSLTTYAELFGGRTIGKAANAIQNKTNDTNNITKTQQWVELYENRGNSANSIFNKGQFKKESGKVGKVVKAVPNLIENTNNFIESMPRITEFVNTIRSEGYNLNDDGKLVTNRELFIEQNKDKMSAEQLEKRASKIKEPTKSLDKVLSEADYNAAEITTNFKRGGAWAKTIDKNGGTFFSASVQGASKFGRTFTEAFGDARSGDFRAARRLFARAMALGVAPALLGKVMYKDDKEYEELPDYVKEQYYVYKMNKVPGLGQTLWKNKPEDQFIRIPKGRAVSIFDSGASRAIDTAKGKEDAFKGYDSLIINQIAPNNPLDSNLLAPLSGAKRNESWSGNQIVSDYLKDKNPYMQYDAKTSEFSKWVGRKLRNTKLEDVPLAGPYLESIKSPKKLDYLIDQYSGVIGDLVLPSMTNYAESEKDSGFNALSNPFKSKFTTNSTLNNRTVSDYYSLKSQVLKDSGNDDATNLQIAKNEYMDGKNSDIKSHLSALYGEQRDIQNNKTLSNAEKYKQNKDKQREIVEYMKKIIKDVENAKEENGVVTIGDKTYVPSKTSYGADTMKEMSESKMNAVNDSGLSIKEYNKVDNYIAGIEADKDINGKSVQGSKKKKAISYLREQGYSDSTIKSIVEGYGWKFKEGD